jgi:plastocyanin
MRLLGPLVALALSVIPSVTGAGDVTLTLEADRFSPRTVTLKGGDRLVVANPSTETHFVWAHAGDYAFDFRATAENGWTHRPGDRRGIVVHTPGRYRLGCALHKDMHAVVIVEE